MSARTLLLSAAAALAFALPAAAEPVAIVGARIETAGPAGAIPRGPLVMTAASPRSARPFRSPPARG